MKTVLLDKAKHDRNRFNCGIEALNNYLKVMASQQSKKDSTRTLVLEDDNNNSYIIGFYTLTMTPIDLKALPRGYKRNTNHRLREASLLVSL